MYVYIKFIEINKHKNIVQIHTSIIHELMAAHVTDNNGYLTIL